MFVSEEKLNEALETLGLDKTDTTLTEESIRKAYKKAALKFHPDKVKDDPKRSEKEEKFLKLKEYQEICKQYINIKDPKGYLRKIQQTANPPYGHKFEVRVPPDNFYAGGHGFERRNTTARESYAYRQTDYAPPRRSGTAYGSYPQASYRDPDRPSYDDYGPSYSERYPEVPRHPGRGNYFDPRAGMPSSGFKQASTPRSYAPPPSPRQDFHFAHVESDYESNGEYTSARRTSREHRKSYAPPPQNFQFAHVESDYESDGEYTSARRTSREHRKYDSGTRERTRTRGPPSEPRQTAPSRSRATPRQDHTRGGRHDSSARGPTQAGNPSSRSKRTAPPPDSRPDKHPGGKSQDERGSEDTDAEPEFRGLGRPRVKTAYLKVNPTSSRYSVDEQPKDKKERRPRARSPVEMPSGVRYVPSSETSAATSIHQHHADGFSSSRTRPKGGIDGDFHDQIPVRIVTVEPPRYNDASNPPSSTPMAQRRGTTVDGPTSH